MKKIYILFVFLLLFSTKIIAQTTDLGQISGNFQFDAQSYNKDTLIKAAEADEKILANTYANLLYTRGNFSAGVRFEGYLNPMLGFNEGNTGVGFPYRFISYKTGELDITAGNFYEQFGNGLIFRSYEDKTLGYDNAMDGVRIKYSLHKGISLKGILGKQRKFFAKDENGNSFLNNQGLIRGVDAEIVLNDLFEKLSTKATQITIGGSFISKYQEGKTIDIEVSRPLGNILVEKTYIKRTLPQNVGAFAGRLNISRGKINIGAEYAYKMNDPSPENNYIYKPGEALLVNFSYSQKGFGFLLTAKRVDNMSFRSDRDASNNVLIINYLPAITKNHTYSLAAMYPYSTQPLGEIGFQAEIMYKFKEGSLLGGKNGMNLSINYSRVKKIDRQPIDTIPVGTSGTDGYKSSFLKFGDELYYQDFNVELTKKFSKSVKAVFIFQSIFYNNTLRHPDLHDTIHEHTLITDVTYKINKTHTIRGEAQCMITNNDNRHWFMGLLEYSVAPHWFFTISDLYNFGNNNPDLRVHYLSASVTYLHGGNRIQLGYGKQRQGIVCVGGVCREVPAANGFMISISSSF